ncbi:glycine betaine transporter OpuD [soil metagenome]
MFWITAALSTALVLWGVLFTSSFGAVTRASFSFIVSNLSWFYMISTTLFLVFVIVLAFSRYGKIRLGKEGEEPEFGRFSWIAMMFQAGMGLALVFFGASEPLTHYADPPFGEAQPYTTGAAQLAMQYSFFHWGLHAWGVFALVGLAVAYFNFRRDTRGLISPIFYPILGERVNGPIGKAIDVLSILVTLIGVAVSLGLGGLQIGAGFGEALGFSNGLGLQLIIISVTIVAYMLSASTPIDKGVKWLSNISFMVGAFLVVYFIAVGPAVTQVNAFTQGIGDYLGGLIPMSFRVNSFNQDTSFLGNYTTFYWAWWVTWAPYVGVFAARISRGRTIREFVGGMLIAPSLITAAWFSIVGATAIDLDQTIGGTLSETAQSNPAIGYFAFLQYLPLPFILSLVSLFMLWIFFVAGADAGTIVLGSMSAGGINNPSAKNKLSWGAAMAAFAAVLLLAGGLEALQQAAVLVAAPFGIVMLFMCWSLYKSLKADAREEERQEESREAEPVAKPAPSPGK